jgi:flagellar FliL protein
MATSAAVKKQPAPAPKAAEASAAPAPAPAPKKSWLLIIVLLLVVLGAGGGAAWWFLLRHKSGDEPAPQHVTAPVFLPLDQFTVNLQPEEGQQQFLQVAVTLKLASDAASEGIKLQMPEVRNRILLLLSSKKPAEVVSVEGKQKLAAEIIEQIDVSIAEQRPAKPKRAQAHKAVEKGKAGAKAEPKPAPAPEPEPESEVLAVLFTHFIVQ